MRKQMLLMEMFNLRVLLLESRIDFLKTKVFPRLEPKAEAMIDSAPPFVTSALARVEGETPAEKLFNYVIAHDPDDMKKFSQWLFNMLIKNQTHLEDLGVVKGYLEQFVQVRAALPPEHRDINRFRSPGDLAEVLDSVAGEDTRSKRAAERELISKEAEVVYNDPQYRITIPKSMEAACQLGVNTKWCTAWSDPNHNMFDGYNRQGPLYVILHKPTNKRWQFHFQSSSFMDEMDRRIDLRKFVQDHPTVAEFFAEKDRGMKAIGTIENIGRYPELTFFEAKDGSIVARTGTETDVGLLAGKPVIRLSLVDGKLQGSGFGSLVPRWASTSFIKGFNSLRSESDKIRNVFASIRTPPSTDLQADLSMFDVFFGSGRYGKISEVGSKLYSGWIGIRTAEEVYLYHPQANLRVMIDEEGKLNTHHRLENSEAQSALMLQIALNDDRIKGFHEDSAFSASSFTEADAQELLEKRPHLADIGILFKAFGPSDERYVDKIKEKLTDMGLEFEKVNDKGVVFKTTTISDVIDDYGNDVAKWIMGLLNGKDSLEIYSTEVNDDLRETLLRSLTPEDLRKVGEYLAREHESFIEEYEIEYDVSSVSGILDLHREVDDLDLENAFSSAAVTGEESGAEGEALRALKSALGNHEYLFFVNSDGLSKKVTNWDTDVEIIISHDQLLKTIQTDSEGLEYEGSERYFFDDNGIDVNEPHYGWSGFDEDAAKDWFIDEIGEFI